MKKLEFGGMIIGVIIIITILMLVSGNVSLRKENDSLSRKLSQLSQAGIPIKVSELPDGNYVKVGCFYDQDEANSYVFLARQSDNPHGETVIAVYSPHWKIPDRFSTKDVSKEIHEFLDKHPELKK